jgi:hypothetical protein
MVSDHSSKLKDYLGTESSFKFSLFKESICRHTQLYLPPEKFILTSNNTKLALEENSFLRLGCVLLS